MASSSAESTQTDYSQLINALITPAEKTALLGLQHEEDEAFISALKALSPDDVRDLILAMTGRETKDYLFYQRMRDLGWNFASDTADPSMNIYGHDDHGYPFIGNLAYFPGGFDSIRIDDVARIVGGKKLVQELFPSK